MHNSQDRIYLAWDPWPRVSGQVSAKGLY